MQAAEQSARLPPAVPQQLILANHPSPEPLLPFTTWAFATGVTAHRSLLPFLRIRRDAANLSLKSDNYDASTQPSDAFPWAQATPTALKSGGQSLYEVLSCGSSAGSRQSGSTHVGLCFPGITVGRTANISGRNELFRIPDRWLDGCPVRCAVHQASAPTARPWATRPGCAARDQSSLMLRKSTPKERNFR